MAGRGPTPKPAHLRRRANKKAGATRLDAPDDPHVPDLPTPDRRRFGRLARAWWRHVWTSPMSSQYLETDIDVLARIAVLVDELQKVPGDLDLMRELRLQEARFGLSPLDRSRLEWEIGRVDPEKLPTQAPTTSKKTRRKDPRSLLKAVK